MVNLPSPISPITANDVQFRFLSGQYRARYNGRQRRTWACFPIDRDFVSNTYFTTGFWSDVEPEVRKYFANKNVRVVCVRAMSLGRFPLPKVLDAFNDDGSK